MTRPHPESDPGLTAENQDDVAGLEDASLPDRFCAVSRERLPKSDMIRFVRSPEGLVLADLAGRLPGRGVWIRADRALVTLAIRKGVFARGLRDAVSVPQDLPDQVEGLLVRRCVDLIGLARKAGQAVCGMDQVRDALRKEPPGILLEALDGGEDGRMKVYFLAKALYSGVKVAGALSAAELGMAFGREHVVHGLVRRGAIAENWMAAYRRLSGFRPAPELTWFPETDQ